MTREEKIDNMIHKLFSLMEHHIVYYMDEPYTIERGYKTDQCNEGERVRVIVPVEHDGDIQAIDYNTLDRIYKTQDGDEEDTKNYQKLVTLDGSFISNFL